jgi:hypothetical protein
MPARTRTTTWGLTRSRWIAEFANAARDLHPEIGLRFAVSVAVREYSSNSHLAPTEAARHWSSLSKDVAS